MIDAGIENVFDAGGACALNDGIKVVCEAIVPEVCVNVDEHSFFKRCLSF